MTAEGQREEGQRVLIVGGGVAGFEAALALRDLAGGRLEVEVHDPRREFVYRPFAVGEPYGALRAFRYGMDGLGERCGASVHAGGIASVDPERRLAIARDGRRLPYDFLIIACGVRLLWAAPGAVTFWGAADEGQVSEVFAELRAGALRHLVFTMPSRHGWALPLYELALLAATELERIGNGDTRVSVVTPEGAPLDVFGRRVGERMEKLLKERGVAVVTDMLAVKFEHGRLYLNSGEAIAADAVISLPRLRGRRIEGAPHDREGFIDVDEHGGVVGLERVFAVGDVTAFPLKQGAVATQQADAVAEAIAAAAGARLDPLPFDPLLRGILWTGHEPRYIFGRPAESRGRPAESRTEDSVFATEPQGPLSSGKVTARYLSPLVDLLEADADPNGRVGSVRASSPT